MGCRPRQFCPDCGNELIHRDHRKLWESSSSLGQFIHRRLPRTFTAADVDVAIRRRRQSGETRLIILEQKQNGHKYQGPQRWLLEDLDRVIRHAVGCVGFKGKLSADSGVYLLFGDVQAEDKPPYRVAMLLPQELRRPNDERVRVFTNEQDVMDWISDREFDLEHQALIRREAERHRRYVD